MHVKWLKETNISLNIRYIYLHGTNTYGQVELSVWCVASLCIWCFNGLFNHITYKISCLIQTMKHQGQT